MQNHNDWCCLTHYCYLFHPPVPQNIFAWADLFTLLTLLPQSGDAPQCSGGHWQIGDERREEKGEEISCSEGHGESYSWRILSWVTELQISKVFDFEPLIFLGYWTEIHYWFSYKKVVLSHWTNSENKSFLQKIKIFLSTATNRLSKLGFYLDFARLGCINSIMGLLRYKIDC